MEVAIIGAGAASVCVLDALSQRTGPPGSVTIYERSGQLWRGRPYQRDAPVVKVNAPPEEMSVRSGDATHFRRWLMDLGGDGGVHDRPDPQCGTRYPSRSLYGDYLVHCADAAIRRLRSRGWRVAVVRGAVTGARPVGERIAVQTDDGRSRSADYAVLCLGGGRPADPYDLHGHHGFIADPYPTHRSLRGIDPRARIAVLGTGLTAVDTVIALAAGGHRGPITMVSRSGTLPAVRQPYLPHRLQHFTPERMRDLVQSGRRVGLPELIRWMRWELLAAGVDPAMTFEEVRTHDTEDPIPRLERHLAAVGSADLGPRILQHAVPDSGQDVWQALHEADRQFVLAGYFRTIMSLCCPMPPGSAATLLRLAQSGQLEICGGMRDATASAGGGFRIRADRRVDADVVVNAVNSPADGIAADTGPLISTLIAQGSAEPDPCGGLRIERATSRLAVGGQPQRRIFALGDITFGSLFFTFGIPVLVDRAAEIVEAIRTDAGGPTGLDSAEPVSATHQMEETV